MIPRIARELVDALAAAIRQVGAGAEVAARPGEHHAPVLVGPIEERGDLGQLVHIGPLTAFFLCGRSKVTVTTPSARSTCRVSMGGTILAAMGLNPFRQHRRTPVDYLMVVGAVVVCLALVLWAMLG